MPHYYDERQKRQYGRVLVKSNNIPELAGVLAASNEIAVQARKRQFLFVLILLIFTIATNMSSAQTTPSADSFFVSSDSQVIGSLHFVGSWSTSRKQAYTGITFSSVSGVRIGQYVDIITGDTAIYIKGDTVEAIKLMFNEAEKQTARYSQLQDKYIDAIYLLNMINLDVIIAMPEKNKKLQHDFIKAVKEYRKSNKL